jgi:hypothetical protein
METDPSFLQPNFENAEVPCFRFSSPIFCSTRDKSDLGAMLAMNLGVRKIRIGCNGIYSRLRTMTF